MIDGFKGIAEYVSKQSGRAFSADAARAAHRREHDPLPVKPFNGRIAADRRDLDAWIERQRGRTLRRAAKAA